MRNSINIGQKFGKLTIIGKESNRKWLCKCDCGTSKSVHGNNLKSGKSISCGCSGMVDMANRIFGSLTVVSVAGKNKHGTYMWKCLCKCGNYTVISGNNLRRGLTKSCGCSKFGSKLTMERFMEKVFPEPNTGCWLWGGYVDRDGYGSISATNICSNRAHRAAYYLFFGEFDTSKIVLHKCDNPTCVNPDHLLLGTSKENTQDMIKKGRNRIGSNHHMSKLSDDQVYEIREEYRTGSVTQKELAERYGVTTFPIYEILNNKAWTHLK